jgi:hypothetical protein
MRGKKIKRDWRKKIRRGKNKIRIIGNLKIEIIRRRENKIGEWRK